ncbi:SDR family NAD(P)-dependent oxidoreductase [Microbacterium sp. No. 7]|uniref:SDR family NAD(P)-dependent oxidoreductase n=1 Tax=Microbacterium sp. No. 7 TaxID=1714373 RepID=UPI0006D1BCD8|nr:SDR family oxidoreductase [Microbacterium sp. No. 7]ALJ19239.1 hypothetical protein AOA12_04715 [Microbacterium sp. No. 7]
MTDNRLEGRVALITGAASGLGAETAKLFASEGAVAGVADIDEVRGQALVDEIAAAGGQAVFLRVDVTDGDTITAAVEELESRFGKLDAVVANAGIGGAASRKKLVDVTEEEMNVVIDINLVGAWRTFKAAIPALLRAGGGTMTLTGSNAGYSILGGSTLGAYTAAKYGATALTRFLASEVAPSNIRVNVVHPGKMLTNFDEGVGLTGEALEAAKDRRRRSDQNNEGALRVMAHPREVAFVHLFFHSSESSFVTGQTLAADGGMDLLMDKSRMVTV